MKDFILVFKTLFKNANPSKKDEDGKKKLSSGAKLLISVSPLIVLVCAMIAFLSISLKNLSEFSLIVTALVGATQLIVLFLSMFSIVSTLYESKDTPFLSTLPLKPTSVFLAKFAMTYVSALQLCAIVILPTVLSGAIAYNVASKTMFYGFYPLLFVIIAFAPILPLFVVVVLSMPVVWLGSYFKSKPTLKSILTILFYLALMCAYMVIVYFMSTRGFGQDGNIEMSQGTLGSLATLANVFYPDKVLVSLCLGIDAGKNFGISAAIIVCMIAIMLVLSSLFYKKINMRKSESVQATESKNVSLKHNDVVVSLMKRDFKSIMRNSTLAMTSFANLLMAPIFIVVMYFISDVKGAEADATSPFIIEMMKIGFVVMYSMIFLAGANMLANMAYTREGKSFFASKTLPINPKDSIKAKLLLSVIVPCVLLVPIMLISLLLYKIDIVSTLFVGIDTLMMITGACCMSILFDMKKGNQHWEQVSDIKNSSQNVYQIISALVSVLPAIVLFVLGIIMASFAQSLGEIAIKVIYWSVGTVFSAAVFVAGLCLLKKYGLKWYEFIGENKPKPKSASRGFGTRRLMK